jgi:hypothetical protein
MSAFATKFALHQVYRVRPFLTPSQSLQFQPYFSTHKFDVLNERFRAYKWIEPFKYSYFNTAIINDLSKFIDTQYYINKEKK